MAVYSAGYARTKAAAQALEDSSAQRRPLPVAPTSEVDTAPVPVHEAVAAPPAANVVAPTVDASASPKVVAAVNPPPAAPVAAKAPAIDSVPRTASVASAPVPVSTGASGTAVTASAPAPISTAPAPAPALPPATVAEKPTADSVVKKVAGWHDGTYTGYGRSRHGDIEATVVIEQGKIAAAVISRCLTQYSCSWIAHLQAQVPARQSPEIDNVSGATQSANAFYYAVVDALGKAK